LNPVVFLKLLFTAFFWGGTFIAGKLLADSMDPFSAAFLRFFIACICLIILTIRIEGRLPGFPLKCLPLILCMGLTGIFSYNLFFFSGLNHIQANQASLIIASNPIFISLFSALFFKEVLNLPKTAGIILSVTGALIVISKGDLFDLLNLRISRGELMIFGCVASWVAYSLLGKKAMNHLSPMVSVTYSSIAGTVMLVFPAVSHGMIGKLSGFSAVDWTSLFYLGFFGTALGFTWYYEGIKQIGPMKAGLFINFVPISAIVLSFLILGESLTVSLAIGAFFVISGVFITNRFGQTGSGQIEST
jgi:drug/metabolite transporter (DMT)-like permease